MLREMEVSTYGKKIIEDVDVLVASCTRFPLAIYIEGGDYDLRSGVSEFAVHSFKMALDIANNIIFRHRKKVKVILGIFINDLGIKHKNPQDRSDFLSGFEAIANAYPVYKKDLFVLSFETNSKNRGVKSLKKLIADAGKVQEDFVPGSLVTEHYDLGQRIFFCHNRSRILLAEITDHKWSVKCPMLMAQHYLDMVTLIGKRVPTAETCTLIDFSEKIDANKVENGALIATKLLLHKTVENKHIVISNHFFWDDSGAMISGSVAAFRRDIVSV
jgi:hypothetical protein